MPDNDNLVSETMYNQMPLYHSCFYVDKDIKENTELCLILSTSQEELTKTGEHKITWYARAPSNRQEYTHYYFDHEHIANNITKDYNIIEKLVAKLKESNLTTNNPVYGFYIAKKIIDPSQILLFLKKNASIIAKKDKYTPIPLYSFEIIAFKTFNPTKSNLGIHNEIFKLLFDNPTSSSDKKVSP